MIEIEMSADVRDYEPKIFGPLSSRQIICFGIAIVMAVPPLLLFTFIPLEIRIIFSIVFAAPGIICGILKLYGMNPEVFFINVLLPGILNPTKRRYCSENKMEILLEKPKQNKKIKYNAKEMRPLR